MPAAPIAAVAFDLDGLMFNTEEVYQRAGTEQLRRRGLEVPPGLFASMMGLRAPEALQVMVDRLGLSDTVEELQEEVSELFDSYLDEVLAPMPGLMGLLEELESAGIPKAVCTSSGEAYAHGLLDRYDLTSRFTFVMGAEHVTHGKPHPEIYATAADRHGVESARMVVLEDAAHGIAAAKAAGAVAVGVPHTHSVGMDYSQADHVIDTLADPKLRSVLGLAS